MTVGSDGRAESVLDTAVTTDSMIYICVHVSGPKFIKATYAAAETMGPEL